MRTTIQYVFLMLLLILPQALNAAGAGITYNGRLLDPSGNPVTGSNVQFRIQIRTPGNENCLMYEEIQNKDLTNSDGVFSITINDGSGSRTDSTGYSLDQIFANRGSFTFTSGYCAVGVSYNTSPADGRKLQVYFNDGSFATGQWEPTPSMAINFIPMAIESQQVGGYKKEQLLKIADGVSSTGTELDSTKWANLLALINGTSTAFVKPSDQITQLYGATVPSPANGQSIRWNSALNAGAGGWENFTAGTASAVTTISSANGDITITNPSTTPQLTLNSGTAANQIVKLDGTAKLPAVDASALTNVNAGKVGGTAVSLASLTSGQVLKYNGSNWVNATLTDNDTLGGLSCASGRVAYYTGGSWGCLEVTSSNTVNTIVSRDGSGVSAFGTVNAGTVKINDGGTGAISLITPAAVTSYTMRLPSSAGTAGQVLTTDGGSPAQLSWSSGGSQWGITGSDIYYNTGNVGIGLTSPSYPLHIAGNTIGLGAGVLSLPSTNRVNLGYSNTVGYNYSIAIGSSNSTGSTDSSIAIGNGNNVSSDLGVAIGNYNTAPGHGVAVGLNINNTTGGSLQIGPSDAAKMTILSTGNVGIGTAAPSSLLTIKSVVNASTLNILGTTGTSIFSVDDSWDNGRLAVKDSTGLERVSLTSYPSNGAYITSNAKVTALQDGATASWGAGLIINVDNAAGNENGIAFGDGGVSIAPAAAITYYDPSSAGYSVGELRFKTSAATNGLTTRMTISKDGNVGIGTAAPVKSLHVLTAQDVPVRIETTGTYAAGFDLWNAGSRKATFGVVGLAGQFVANSGVNDLVFRPDASGNFIFANATETTQLLKIMNSGNIGVGVVNPTVNLDVVGTTGIRYTRAGATTSVTLSDYSGSQPGIYLAGADSTVSTFLHSKGPTKIFSGGTDPGSGSAKLVFYGDTSGQVGIGTAAPDQTLSVNGDASKVGGGSWQTFSDARLKTVNGDFTRGLEEVLQLQPISYHYNDRNPAGVPNNGNHIGFVAQDVQKVIPEAISHSKKGYLMVNNDPIIWTMFNAIKELYYKIVGQEKSVQEVQKENEVLKSKIKDLELQNQAIKSYLCDKDPKAMLCQ